MNVPNCFIIVDDDKLVNMFCSMMIKKFVGLTNIKTFENPETALEFLKELPLQDGEEPNIILFLDINMPTMSGWDFLEFFKDLDDKIKRAIQIYILSSSVDERDLERALDNEHVKAFLVKPLTKDMLLSTTTN